MEFGRSETETYEENTGGGGKGGRVVPGEEANEFARYEFAYSISKSGSAAAAYIGQASVELEGSSVCIARLQKQHKQQQQQQQQPW